MRALENRIPPPIVIALIAAIMWAASFLSPPLVANNGVRYAFVAGFFGACRPVRRPRLTRVRRAKTTIDPVHVDRASTVVKAGIYRITRNPMYVAMMWLLLSWAAYLAAPISFAGPLIFALFITRFQIVPEERAMAAKFGAAYLDYRSRVRRWL